MHCENSRAVCEGSLTGEKKSLAGSREGQKRGFKVWEGGGLGRQVLASSCGHGMFVILFGKFNVQEHVVVCHVIQLCL